MSLTVRIMRIIPSFCWPSSSDTARGAFTGASDNKKGVVELCNGGILFLDEVHRLPPEGQEILFT